MRWTYDNTHRHSDQHLHNSDKNRLADNEPQIPQAPSRRKGTVSHRRRTVLTP
ncbi:MAG: hypothetical protein AAFR81_15905 [Chloroflexota bacterium]